MFFSTKSTSVWSIRPPLVQHFFIQTPHRYGIAPVCILTWSTREEFREKALIQYVQTYGFSPEWVLMWFLITALVKERFNTECALVRVFPGMDQHILFQFRTWNKCTITLWTFVQSFTSMQLKMHIQTNLCWNFSNSFSLVWVFMWILRVMNKCSPHSFLPVCIPVRHTNALQDGFTFTNIHIYDLCISVCHTSDQHLCSSNIKPYPMTIAICHTVDFTESIDKDLILSLRALLFKKPHTAQDNGCHIN